MARVGDLTPYERDGVLAPFLEWLDEYPDVTLARLLRPVVPRVLGYWLFFGPAQRRDGR